MKYKKNEPSSEHKVPYHLYILYISIMATILDLLDDTSLFHVAEYVSYKDMFNFRMTCSVFYLAALGCDQHYVNSFKRGEAKDVPKVILELLVKSEVEKAEQKVNYKFFELPGLQTPDMADIMYRCENFHCYITFFIQSINLERLEVIDRYFTLNKEDDHRDCKPIVILMRGYLYCKALCDPSMNLLQYIYFSDTHAPAYKSKEMYMAEHLVKQKQTLLNTKYEKDHLICICQILEPGLEPMTSDKVSSLTIEEIIEWAEDITGWF